jgi:hypothetical protein
LFGAILKKVKIGFLKTEHVSVRGICHGGGDQYKGAIDAEPQGGLVVTVRLLGQHKLA